MYYVLGDGGAKFGPADVPTLKQWVTEGRLTQTTMLEDAVTGQVMAATSVPDLFSMGSAPMTSPPSSSPGGPYTVPGPPAGEASSPYGAPAGGAAPGPYAAPQNPYPRMDSVASPEADKYALWTWILGGVGLLCCPCCFGGGAIFTAIKARQLGHPKGDMLLFYAIGMTVGGIIFGVVVRAAMGSSFPGVNN